MSRPLRATLAALALVGLALGGCGKGGEPAEASGSLRVVDATVDVPPNPSQASVRFVVDNRSDEADELVAAASPDARAVEVHRSEVDDDGLATMQEVDRLAIPARSQVTFEPGGLHVMLRDPSEPLEAGQTVELDLTFAEAGTRTVTVRVVEPGTAPTDGGETEHDDHAS